MFQSFDAISSGKISCSLIKFSINNLDLRTSRPIVDLSLSDGIDNPARLASPLYLDKFEFVKESSTEIIKTEDVYLLGTFKEYIADKIKPTDAKQVSKIFFDQNNFNRSSISNLDVFIKGNYTH
tara:strand:+ start:379 stop:750 length:372 start_codon:yes stop_codon:yes gene_type:complete